MKQIYLAFLLLQLFNSGCSSIITLSNEVIIKDDPKVKFKTDNHYLISIGESHTPFQSYQINGKNHKVRSVTINYQKCWHASLGGVIIPVPFIPLFRVPHNYSIKILSKFWNEKEEYDFLKSLEVFIIIKGVPRKAILKNKMSEFIFSYEDSNFEFPVKCNAFDDAEILIKEPSNDDIIIKIERDTSLYYRWIAVQ